jgi:hypothetical protein
MKNYIANETGGWATSTAFIRQSLYKAIEIHRRARNDDDLYESLRLLGQVSPRQTPSPDIPNVFQRLSRFAPFPCFLLIAPAP